LTSLTTKTLDHKHC